MMEASKIAHKINTKQRTSDVLMSENVDFAGLLLSEPVQRGLLSSGFEKPSPIQLKAIPLGRCGLDLIVQAKSGTGKTCVFSVIALESLQLASPALQVLVLAPTREIAVQIQDVIKNIGICLPRLACHTFIGGLPVKEDIQKLKRCHVAIGSPGRVKQLIESGLMSTDSIRLFILDEADKLLEDSFQEQINWIYSSLPDNKQILALSATYPEYLAQHLTAYMRNPTFIRLNISDPALLGIKQYYMTVSHHPLPNKELEYKTKAVIEILSNIMFKQCLIFSNYQTRAQNLCSDLQSEGWPTTCIAGSLDQKERLEAMNQLKMYKCRVLISTDLTSRGIDADKVDLVINLDVPYDHETYLHRIGRAGRYGSFGAGISIVSEGKEKSQLHAVEKKCHTKISILPVPIPNDLVKQEVKINIDDIISMEQLVTVSDVNKLTPDVNKSTANINKSTPDINDNPCKNSESKENITQKFVCKERKNSRISDNLSESITDTTTVADNAHSLEVKCEHLDTDVTMKPSKQKFVFNDDIDSNSNNRNLSYSLNLKNQHSLDSPIVDVKDFGTSIVSYRKGKHTDNTETEIPRNELETSATNQDFHNTPEISNDDQDTVVTCQDIHYTSKSDKENINKSKPSNKSKSQTTFETNIENLKEPENHKDVNLACCNFMPDMPVKSEPEHTTAIVSKKDFSESCEDVLKSVKQLNINMCSSPVTKSKQKELKKTFKSNKLGGPDLLTKKDGGHDKLEIVTDSFENTVNPIVSGVSDLNLGKQDGQADGIIGEERKEVESENNSNGGPLRNRRKGLTYQEALVSYTNFITTEHPLKIDYIANMKQDIQQSFNNKTDMNVYKKMMLNIDDIYSEVYKQNKVKTESKSQQTENCTESIFVNTDSYFGNCEVKIESSETSQNLEVGQTLLKANLEQDNYKNMNIQHNLAIMAEQVRSGELCFTSCPSTDSYPPKTTVFVANEKGVASLSEVNRLSPVNSSDVNKIILESDSEFAESSWSSSFDSESETNSDDDFSGTVYQKYDHVDACSKINENVGKSLDMSDSQLPMNEKLNSRYNQDKELNYKQSFRKQRNPQCIGHPDWYSQHAGHPDWYSQHAGHPDWYSQHTGHPDWYSQHTGHPDWYSQHAGHPDWYSQHAGHPDWYSQHAGHPDWYSQHDGHPDWYSQHDGHPDWYSQHGVHPDWYSQRDGHPDWYSQRDGHPDWYSHHGVLSGSHFQHNMDPKWYSKSTKPDNNKCKVDSQDSNKQLKNKDIKTSKTSVHSKVSKQKLQKNSRDNPSHKFANENPKKQETDDYDGAFAHHPKHYDKTYYNWWKSWFQWNICNSRNKKDPTSPGYSPYINRGWPYMTSTAHDRQFNPSYVRKPPISEWERRSQRIVDMQKQYLKQMLN